MKFYKNIVAIALIRLIALIGLFSCSSLPNQKNSNLKEGAMNYSFRSGSGIVAVFQSGLGDDKSIWSSVIKKLPAEQAYFAYDRYGYGKSDSSKSPRNACNIAREQHELLQSAGIKPPYLLVGHSLGGLYEYVFALMYPQDVAGLLLLDPTHPKHWQTMQSETPVSAALLKTFRYTIFSFAMRDEFDAQTDCLNHLPEKLQASISAHTRIFVSTKGQHGDFLKMLNGLRKDWLQLTTIAALEPVENSTHYIQVDRPDVVVAAIAQLTHVTQ